MGSEAEGQGGKTEKLRGVVEGAELMNGQQVPVLGKEQGSERQRF